MATISENSGRNKYKRTLSELSSKAAMYWPDSVRQIAGKFDSVERLMSTLEDFKEILSFESDNPEYWINLLRVRKLPANIFLKHLMIFSDLGNEALSKLEALQVYFPDGYMDFTWKEKARRYELKSKSGNIFSADRYKANGIGLLSDYDLTDEICDWCMFIMFGSLANNVKDIDENEKRQVKGGKNKGKQVKVVKMDGNLIARCNLGQYSNAKEELLKIMSTAYIYGSRQTSGANANALGQAAQAWVIEMLILDLPGSEGWTITSNGQIPGIRMRSETDNTFDIVVIGPDKKITGIEISFQQTTNSTIERKAQLARDAHSKMSSEKHALAFVLDGIGSLTKRTSASSTICEFSDCTVALTRPELRILANFLRERSDLHALPEI
jgi:hypothetical protein